MGRKKQNNAAFAEWELELPSFNEIELPKFDDIDFPSFNDTDFPGWIITKDQIITDRRNSRQSRRKSNQ